MNGIEKYVNETTQTAEDEMSMVKPVAEAKPRMKSTTTLTPVSFPPREGKWVDVDPGSYDHECQVASKAMTRLLRHDQNIPRETDRASNYEDIVEEFNKKEEEIRAVLRNGRSGGGAKKRFQ